MRGRTCWSDLFDPCPWLFSSRGPRPSLYVHVSVVCHVHARLSCELFSLSLGLGAIHSGVNFKSIDRLQWSKDEKWMARHFYTF